MRISTEIGWGNKPGGARRVAVNILREVARLRPDDELLVYSNCYFDQLVAPNVRQITLPPAAPIAQTLWDQLVFPHWVLPKHLANDAHDIAHFTNNYISAWGGQPAVVTIHDMTPFVIPESYGSAHGAWLRAHFRLSARRARHIVTVSENSKADICRILNVVPQKVTVVPLAANLREQTDSHQKDEVDLRGKFGIERPFVLYVGAIHPRKNVARLIEAYVRLRRRGDINHQLVIAGAKRWMANDIFAALGKAAANENDIVFTDRVTDTELVALYEEADVFVYPSIYEGFGLPVLEAMSLGAPVVTSRGSSLSEVAGDAAILVDPFDTESIADAIAEIVASPSLREELEQLGRKRASAFSWENTARGMLRVFDNVAR